MFSLMLLFSGSNWAQASPAKPPTTVAVPERTADIEKAVALLCPQNDITRSKTGKVSGCRVCPEGTDFRGQSTGDQWGIYGTTFGHFTSPTEDNLLLSGAGCDSHANNWGGTFLFTFKMGEPRLVRYEKGATTDKCNKLAFPQGGEFLVCRAGWTGQGENDSFLFSYVLNPSGMDTGETLFATQDTTATCGDPDDREVRFSSIEDVHFSFTRPGIPSGMTVTAYRGELKCSQVAIKLEPGKLRAGVKTYKVEYTFDGRKFQVTPSSRETLKLFTPE